MCSRSPLFGGSFGFDFNPMADAIRLTSDGEQNARISPATGLVTFSDPPLAAVPADPNPQTSGVETSGESGSDGGYSGSADGRSSIDTKSRSRSPV